MRSTEPGRHRAYACMGIAAAGLGVLLSFSSYMQAPVEAHTEAWRGYRSLLVEESVPDSEVMDALSKAGVTGVISASTEPVLISNWSGLEQTTLSLALARLIPGDPRRDPYIDGLGSWFRARVQGRGYRVYYLRVSPFSEALRAGDSALAPFSGRFILPESGATVSGSAPQRWMAMGAVGIVLLYVLVSALGPSRRLGPKVLRRFLLRLCLVLPWLALAWRGTTELILSLLWTVALVELSASLDIPLEELRRNHAIGSTLKSLLRGGRPPLSALLVASGALVLAPACLLVTALAILSSAGFLIAFCCASLLESRLAKRGRLEFVPIAIGRRGRTRDYASAGICILALVAWAAFRIVPVGSGESQAAGIEMPMPLPGRGNPAPSLEEARAQANSSQAMPGLAQWLVHRAFQEALPLARLKEGRSDPFAQLSLGKGGATGPSIVFNESWRTSALRGIPPNSIEAMLLAQGGSVRGASLPWQPTGSGPLAPIEALLYIFLLVPPIRRIAAGAGAARSSPSGEIRQAA
ncbi:MAG TPA: hypothetical protein VFL04_02465 [Rectinemataceae bacterium]|nr:hypothetical protein [Rectinemataceae bacterium]